jgi:hypothetical protein
MLFHDLCIHTLHRKCYRGSELLQEKMVQSLMYHHRPMNKTNHAFHLFPVKSCLNTTLGTFDLTLAISPHDVVRDGYYWAKGNPLTMHSSQNQVFKPFPT